jgi:hypothetical protein
VCEALRILEIHGSIRIKPGPGVGPVVAPISWVDLGETLTCFMQASGTTFREVMTAERGDAEVEAALQAGIDCGAVGSRKGTRSIQVFAGCGVGSGQSR